MASEQETIYHSRPIRELGIAPEKVDLITWYNERLKALGDTNVEPADATDGQNWKAELTKQGEVKEITGAHFIVRGSKVTRYKPDGEVEFSWNQPGIHQAETEMSLPTRNGEMKVMTSGFVAILRDEAGNVLLSVAPEPFARTPKKALLRTPFQTSATKMQALLAGEKEKDRNLYDLLVNIGGSEDISTIFKDEKIDVFPLPYADANRIDATNYGFAITISDSELREKLKNNDQNRWCNPAEVREIMRAGLLNGHTAAAIFASTSLVK